MEFAVDTEQKSKLEFDQSLNPVLTLTIKNVFISKKYFFFHFFLFGSRNISLKHRH